MHKLFPMVVAFGIAVASHAHALSGKVVGVTDGDTITVLTESNFRRKVRLASIDAPESGQAFGKAAKQELSKLLCGAPVGKRACDGKQVHVTEDDVDRYGRLIGIVTVGDTNANKHMVASGLAWVYVKYLPPNHRDDSFLLWQAYAKQERRGLWIDDAPTPPWEFRKGKPR